jgi:hypothetical protein
MKVCMSKGAFGTGVGRIQRTDMLEAGQKRESKEVWIKNTNLQG